MTITTSRTKVVVTAPLTGIEARRGTGVIRRSDIFSILGSAVAAVSLSSWLFSQLMVFHGVLGFVATSYLLFLIIYSVVVRFDESKLAVRDRVVSVIVQSIAFLMLIVLVIVVIYTVSRGVTALGHANFFTTDMSQTGPLDPLSSGGILHAIAGTLIMILMALIISIPLGVTTAVFISEFPGKFSRLIRTVVEAMTALPSIVAGLFIYATVILSLGFDRSGFAASLAMTVMMLPIIIRSGDVVLRLVPGNLKEASYALGSSTWRTVWNVTLPTARSGLTTAIILGTARGIGETSPVLLTAGVTTYFNANPFSGAMVSLPLATFSFVKSPEPGMVARGFGSAAVLMVLVLILFAIARLIGGRGAGVLSVRQQKRRTQLSRDDVSRFSASQPGAARGVTSGSGRGAGRLSDSLTPLTARLFPRFFARKGSRP
ncbi:MAG: phosphate ABC transporter permease PstA [Microbacteriaceae bacterium]|nr:phosphate ABC transporter permease PstA [Microbacteriaceae bacterium]